MFIVFIIIFFFWSAAYFFQCTSETIELRLTCELLWFFITFMRQWNMWNGPLWFSMDSVGVGQVSGVVYDFIEAEHNMKIDLFD